MTAVFFIYLATLFYFVFFSTDLGSDKASISQYPTINLIPFRTIKHYFKVRNILNPSVFIINVYGNIAAFMPFGFLMPFVKCKSDKWRWILLSSIILSLFIELTQITLGVGVIDVDDVVLNVAGGILGYIFYKLTKSIFKDDKS